MSDQIDFEPAECNGEQGSSCSDASNVSKYGNENDEKSISSALMTPLGDSQEHNEICLHIFQKVLR